MGPRGKTGPTGTISPYDPISAGDGAASPPEQKSGGIAFGVFAAITYQHTSIAIGKSAGQGGQLYNSIAIGEYAAMRGQYSSCIAIGSGAAASDALQTSMSIAIGKYSGTPSLENTISISAVNLPKGPQTTSCFLVEPIRSVSGNSTGNQRYPLKYNPVTGEITID
jgi:hypothetical protein